MSATYQFSDYVDFVYGAYLYGTFRGVPIKLQFHFDDEVQLYLAVDSASIMRPVTAYWTRSDAIDALAGTAPEEE